MRRKYFVHPFFAFPDFFNIKKVGADRQIKAVRHLARRGKESYLRSR